VPLRLYGVELPGLRNSLEAMHATVDEDQAGPSDQVPHSAGHQDLTGIGQGGDSGADVQRDACERVTVNLHLAGVHASSNGEAVAVGALADGDRGLNGAGGPVERGNEAVPGGVEFTSPITGELVTDVAVVAVQEVPPRPVAQRAHEAGGVDQIGEQQDGELAARRIGRRGARQELLNYVQEPISVSDPGNVVVPGQLDESGVGRSSRVGSRSLGTRSDIPVPRLSKMIRRENDASRSRKCANDGCSQASSTLDTNPGTCRRSKGPSPIT
jgi:hypothetical protein